MRGLVMLLLMVILAGCTTSRALYSAPGERQLSVGCPPAFPAKCRERAESECGGGFEVLAVRDDIREHRIIVRCD